MIDATYTYWREALQGRFGSVHDGDPQSGFYKIKNKTGPWRAVAIWYDGEKMAAVDDGKPADAAEIWTWVCQNPITEEVYRRVESGGGWPDAIEELIGSNNPPAEEAAADEVESAVNAALAALKEPVTDQTGADKLGNHRDRLAKLWKAKDKERETQKAPHLEAAGTIEDAFRPVLAKLKDAGIQVKAALTKWFNAEEDRIKKEALAKIKADEEARKAAADKGEPPPPPAPLPEIERPKAGTSGRATALRTYKSAVINDYKTALAHFADNAEVKELIQTLADRCARADIAVPGCEIKTDRRAA